MYPTCDLQVVTPSRTTKTALVAVGSSMANFVGTRCALGQRTNT